MVKGSELLMVAKVLIRMDLDKYIKLIVLTFAKSINDIKCLKYISYADYKSMRWWVYNKSSVSYLQIKYPQGDYTTHMYSSFSHYTQDIYQTIGNNSTYLFQACNLILSILYTSCGKCRGYNWQTHGIPYQVHNILTYLTFIVKMVKWT